MAAKTSNVPVRVELDITARDGISKAEFDEMMEAGLAQAQAGQGVTLDACFRHLRGSIGDGICGNNQNK